jgi:hypothetical protein
MKGLPKEVGPPVMIFSDQIRDHQSRCQPHLLTLRMLARGEADAPLSSPVAIVVRDATNAVIAEAEAAGRAALAATADGRRHPEAETFLWVRLARLARAADEAVDAARRGDNSGLRDHLTRFSALTAAIWAVQQAVYVQVPATPPLTVMVKLH